MTYIEDMWGPDWYHPFRPPHDQPGRDIPQTWEPIDLGPYLRGEIVRPEPRVGLARSDGLRLLYPGKEHAVVAEMEAGKSWFSSACCTAEMADGHPVVYIHFEESDPLGTIERLQALGVDDHDILKLFKFVGPEQQVTRAAINALLVPTPSLVVLDGVNEAMSLHGWGVRDEDGAAQFRKHLVKPCTAVGAAVLSNDHVVKNVEARGRNAIGSIHKGNGLNGVLIMLENAEPFGRGQRGRSHVYVTKDRPGNLRRHGRPTKTAGKTFMGELVVDDTRLRVSYLDLMFWAPAEQAQPEQTVEHDADPIEAIVLETVKALADKGAEANLRAVRGLAGVGKDKVDGALERLVFSGVLTESRGPNRSRIFTLSGVAEDLVPVAA